MAATAARTPHQPAAAAPPRGPRQRKMKATKKDQDDADAIACIFEWADTDRDTHLIRVEFNRLQQQCGHQKINQGQWESLCMQVSCDPAAGIKLHSLAQLYAVSHSSISHDLECVLAGEDPESQRLLRQAREEDGRNRAVDRAAADSSAAAMKSNYAGGAKAAGRAGAVGMVGLGADTYASNDILDVLKTAVDQVSLQCGGLQLHPPRVPGGRSRPKMDKEPTGLDSSNCSCSCNCRAWVSVKANMLEVIKHAEDLCRKAGLADPTMLKKAGLLSDAFAYVSQVRTKRTPLMRRPRPGWSSRFQ